MSWVRHLALLAALACSAPVAADERIDDPVTVAVEGVATPSQVGRAVRAALTRRGWTVIAEKAGTVEAKLVKNDEYVVRIAVSYDASSIVVRYVKSEGLDYDREDRTIHSSYNRWMRMLSREIKVNLALFAGAEPDEHENPHEPALVPQVVPVLPQGAAPPAAPAKTLRANAQLRAQAKLSASVMATNPAPVPVAPKGPIKNGEGSWWYVKTATGSGWVLESELQ